MKVRCKSYKGNKENIFSICDNETENIFCLQKLHISELSPCPYLVFGQLTSLFGSQTFRSNYWGQTTEANDSLNIVQSKLTTFITWVIKGGAGIAKQVTH